MGNWFWSSTNPAPKPSPTQDTARPESAPEPPSNPPDIADTLPLQPHHTLSREEQADADLQSLLSTFRSENEASKPREKNRFSNISPFPARDRTLPPTSQPQPTQTSTSQPTERSDHDRTNPDGSLDISAEALLPRTMSCRQAFDAAFYCQSLGGKFNDIYRYGALRSCGEHWGDFWFCMRSRNYPKSEAERQEMIRAHYRERDWKRYRRGPSSEDVWEMRDVPVQRAFWRDPDAEEEELG
ncbi:hypothetical protein LTR66_013696 [Elasticomyces elasticus]|nr:hypothetical protein LTR66_013696 [Elasticomyces elasticus]